MKRRLKQIADGRQRRGWVLLVALAAISLAMGCSVLEGAFAPPLPPAETIGLQAKLLTSGNVASDSTMHLSWTPPRESDEVDSVVIEQAGSPDGPWEEIAAVRPERGYHQETSIFRPGRLYYFRAFLTRGNEEGPTGAPIEVWVPAVTRPPTPTPAPLPTSTPTG